MESSIGTGLFSPLLYFQFLVSQAARSPDAGGKALSAPPAMFISALLRRSLSLAVPQRRMKSGLPFYRELKNDGRRSPAMIEVITLDSLQNLSDAALWALFDETHDLIDNLPYGSWERGIALVNLGIIMVMIDRRRLHVATELAR